jgi:putative ABC transport system permease protein
LNLVLLVGAFTAIVTFKGFKTHVLASMTKVLVETQLGHVQVAKPQYWNNASVNRAAERMISDPEGLIQKLKLDGVEYISPRVSFYGLINTESKSQSTRFVGFDPQLESKVESRLKFMEGGPFAERKQAIISSGLQKVLKVKMGDTVTVVSPTLDGSINAMDLTILGVFKSGFADVDDGTVFLSLKDAQKVLDSNAANNLMIMLKDPDQAEAVKLQLQKLVGPMEDPRSLEGGLQVKTWRQLSDMYIQVENFFNFQNTVIEIILLLLLLLSVSNTMSMTVFERLSEIGTLRALGDYEGDIRRLMLLEAILLGLVAVLVAVPFSYAFVKGISNLAIPVTLPLSSQPIFLRIIPYPESYFEATFVCFFSIVVASLWPARKGAKTPIVEALRAKT